MIWSVQCVCVYLSASMGNAGVDDMATEFVFTCLHPWVMRELMIWPLHTEFVFTFRQPWMRRELMITLKMHKNRYTHRIISATRQRHIYINH